MERMAIPIPQKAIPVPRIREDRSPRPRRPKNNPERVLEIYFAVLTVVILGGIGGLAAYTVRVVIPELQKSHSPRSMEYPLNHLFDSHPDERQ